jgi:hypothetical protein
MSEIVSKPANGVSGCLLQPFTEGPVIFRVYNEDKTFTDYDLWHSDLFVTINDTDAYFYKTNKYQCLDHAPSTLGLGINI